MTATKAEIFEELEALSAHYPRIVRGPDQQERFFRDYLDDLSSSSLSAVVNGCKAWRASDATKFPTPGQLLKFVRANEVDDRPRGEHTDPWRELSDAEYARLSLREKIRHQTILGNQCAAKAGPMWANGEPAERPPHRQRWAELAQNHYAEATRLQQMLHRAEGAA